MLVGKPRGGECWRERLDSMEKNVAFADGDRKQRPGSDIRGRAGKSAKGRNINGTQYTLN